MTQREAEMFRHYMHELEILQLVQNICPWDNEETQRKERERLYEKFAKDWGIKKSA